MDENILEKIYKSGLKLLEPLDSQTIYSTIAHEAMKLVKGDESRIMLRENSEFNLVYAYPQIAADLKVRKKGFAYKSFIEQKAFVVDFSAYPKVHPEIQQRGVISALFIPLSYKKQSIGVLVVQSYSKKKFTQHELDILKLFGSMASLAIRKTSLYDETHKALELRDEFISLAAHELRTPMTTISGYIQLLNGKLSASHSLESKWTNELLKESRRLTNIISELVEVNRINAGKYHYNLNHHNLISIVNKAIDRFSMIDTIHKINVDYKIKNGEDIVIADQEKLFMVISSLFDNAAKFSPVDSRIDVNIKSNLKHIILSIQDYGEGMSEEELGNLFQSFRKEQTGTGLGLGLFLAKNIIEKHKGEIIVRSKKKKGTKVEIKLPKIKI